MLKLYRCVFQKCDEAVFISHLDLQQVMQRAIKKARIPVYYTEGYNPRLYIAFPLPLSLGHAGLRECFDFKAEEGLDCAGAVEALSACMPAGLTVLSIREAGQDKGRIASALYTLFWSADNGLLSAVEAYNAMDKAVVTRKNKKGREIAIDLKEYVPALTAQEGEGGFIINVNLPVGSDFTLNPVLLTRFLQKLGGPPAGECAVTRRQVYLAGGETFC